MAEIWKPIPGFGDRYEASSRGRVRVRKTKHVMRPAPGKKGYLHLSLSSEDVKTTVDVHRLILLAFVGPPPTTAHQSNHKDGRKAHNAVENLEWVSYGENMEHADTVLGAFPFRRAKHPAAKLTEEDVAAIRKARLDGERVAAIAKRHSISQSQAYDIIKGKAWPERHQPRPCGDDLPK